MSGEDNRQATRDQRQIVVRDLEHFVERARGDLEDDGSLSEGNRGDVESGTRVLEWLRGEQPSADGVLSFLESRLAHIEEEVDYEQLLRDLFEREAYEAVISGLR
jgi:hypothetical protein